MLIPAAAFRAARRPKGIHLPLLLLTCCAARTYAGTAVARGAAALKADSLLREALLVSKRLDPSVNEAACRKEFSKLVAEARDRLGRAQDSASAEGRELEGREVVEILNDVLLTDRQVAYMSRKHWRDGLFTSALVKRRGNCAAVSTLYYLVARQLSLPIRMVSSAEHAWVRFDDGESCHDIETTADGLVIAPERTLYEFDIGPDDRSEAGLGYGLDEDEARALLLRVWAQAFTMLNDQATALSFYEKALKLWPGNLDLRLDNAMALANAGERERARAIIAKVLTKAKGRYLLTRARAQWAYVLESEGDFDGAIGSLRSAMRSSPRILMRVIAMRLGHLYRHKRDFPRAIAYHEMAANIRADEDALLELGSVLTEAHRDEEAIAAYEAAMKLNPENFFPQVILAGLYERTGHRAKGRDLFAGIKESRGNRVTWLCALVWYYAVIGDKDKLLESMKGALELDRSGRVHRYFVREPDLDRYRKDPEFGRIMERHEPR
ncbi:MAG: tetratricopeptide repeat protein [Planctomycetota bacterium]|jgi:tetratricopeptide (TPR) repeat protein